MFNCSMGEWPIKYLGVPVSGSRLHISDWRPLVEKIDKRLDGWKGGTLSLGGRITLLNACLSSMPLYSMSMYLLPKSVVRKIEGNIIWWNRLRYAKLKKWGLGIKDLRKMNISLLCKWWWRLEKGEGLWQEIVKKKYMKQHCISMLKKKPSNSPV